MKELFHSKIRAIYSGCVIVYTLYIVAKRKRGTRYENNN